MTAMVQRGNSDEVAPVGDGVLRAMLLEVAAGDVNGATIAALTDRLREVSQEDFYATIVWLARRAARVKLLTERRAAPLPGMEGQQVPYATLPDDYEEARRAAEQLRKQQKRWIMPRIANLEEERRW